MSNEVKVKPMSRKKDGGLSIVESTSKDRLLALLATLEPIDDTFPNVDETLPPLDDVELCSSQ